MTIPENDASIFERALRGDLPSSAQEERLRRRLLTSGVAIGGSLVTANAVASSQASIGATLVAKVAGLSWPATLVLTTALATPVVALPLWLGPGGRGPQTSAHPLSSSQRQPALAAVSVSAAEPARPVEASEPGSRTIEGEPKWVDSKQSASTPAPSNSLGASRVEVKTPAARAEPTPVAAFEAIVPVASVRLGPTSNSSTLGAETELLDRAFAALRTGDRSTAAALIAEHEQRFPNGLLREERERARARLEKSHKGE